MIAQSVMHLWLCMSQTLAVTVALPQLHVTSAQSLESSHDLSSSFSHPRLKDKKSAAHTARMTFLMMKLLSAHQDLYNNFVPCPRRFCQPHASADHVAVAFSIEVPVGCLVK
jgi:hypothetical protein